LTSIVVRRFRDKTLLRLAEEFDQLSAIASDELAELLTDLNETVPVNPRCEIEIRGHESRLELAQYLWRVLEPLHAGNPGRIENDQGLWTWLALAHLDVLEPAGKGGRRRVGEMPRWLAAEDRAFGPAKVYRHVMLGPFTAFAAHHAGPLGAGEESPAAIMLCGPIGVTNEGLQRLSERQDVVSSRAVVQAATWLYFDPVTQRTRSGYTAGPGSLQRYIAVVSQLDLVWDLPTMAAEKLWELLPPEFDRWKLLHRHNPNSTIDPGRR